MKITALAGGVGGGKLVDGLNRLDAGIELTVIVNTGDDFSHYGLWVSPDLDTVCYNLADRANLETGWGRKDESWETLGEIQQLGGLDWFKLGNKDLAVHLERTRRMENGQRLSQITADFCESWGVKANVLPMSDDPLPTLIETDQGVLPFQEYFVRLQCQPRVEGFIFENAALAKPAPGVLETIRAADLVIICPSNPWVSIDPILSVPGIRTELEKKTILGVSPLIGGQAVKGPAAKMYREMNIDPTAAAVADHYQGLLDGFVIDISDQELQGKIVSENHEGLSVFCSNIWMKDLDERRTVAEEILRLGSELVKEV
jgi:LPPG:FO 2-phospho-L-lactate transferase